MTPASAGPPSILRALGRARPPRPSTAREAARRARVVPWLEDRIGEIARVERARRRLRTSIGLVAAAAAIALAASATALHPSAPPLAASGVRASAPLASVDVFATSGAVSIESGPEGTRISTAATSSARVALVGGASARVLEGGTVIAPRAAPETLRLERGGVHVDVPKLPEGTTLSIATADATVVVRGTTFDVRRIERSGGPTRTWVHVEEGRVEVQCAGAIVLLGPGDSWTSPSTASTPITVPSSTSAAAGSPRPPLEDGTLGDENRLFERARVLDRAGRPDEALRVLDALLARYPRSVLRNEARLERLRILERLHRDDAADRERRRWVTESPAGSVDDSVWERLLAPSAAPEPKR